MTLCQAFARLAAYLVCIGLALELSHRLYWRISQYVSELNISTLSRSVLGILIAFIPLGSAVAITATFAGLLDKQSLISLGLSYDGESLTRVSFGAAISLSCVTVAFLLGILMGYIKVKPSKLSEDCISCLPLFLGGLMDFFTAAVFEEIIFRGYVYFVLLKSGGLYLAIIGSAIVFSTAHLIKHTSVPLLYVLNAFVFGILVAVCRYFTCSLWLPVGLHFGWNVVSGPIFGLPYSGRTYDRGVVVSEVSGPTWLTGGQYSLDAGVLGTLAIAIAAASISAISPMY
jgi:membrane protease YdiL (CAAX protease family)